MLKLDYHINSHTYALDECNELNVDHSDEEMTKSVVPESTDLIPGAINFRRIQGHPLFATSAPLESTARGVVRYIETVFKSLQVYWVNLRDVPVVYIKGKPFVLRSIRDPFQNMNDFESVDPQRLEDMEQSLKKDVLAEVQRSGNKVLLHSEAEMGSLVVFWESIEDESDVLTSQEMFHKLCGEGLCVAYTRIPLSAGAVPSTQSIDALLTHLFECQKDVSMQLVYSCQLGRGRSTIASAIASMQLQKSFFQDESTSVTAEYSCILSLARVLKHGVRAKRWVNAILLNVGAVLNLQDMIQRHYQLANTCRTAEGKTDHVNTALEYLRAYFTLVCVAAYQIEARGLEEVRFVSHSSPVPFPNTPCSYTEWFNARKEITTLYNKIQDESALRSAALDKVLSGPPEKDDQHAPVKASPPSLQHPTSINHQRTPKTKQEQFELERKEEQQSQEQEMLLLVAHRDGNVLVKGTILKSDHFPGCNRLKDTKPVFEGVPNFRGLSIKTLNDVRMYGMAIPTVKGMGQVLEYLQV